jgi:hypothetical protein
MPADDRVTKAGTPERWSRILTYRPGADGHVEARRDDGFEDVNAVHDRAWRMIHREAADAWREVAEGRRSPLYYHMVASLMDAEGLAQYVGLWTWRVRRHLRPDVFRRLGPALLQKYAWALRLTAEELSVLPPEPPPVDAPSPDGTAAR